MFGLSLASIRWIAGGIVAAVIFGIGYKVGHRRVAELEAELTRIEQAGKEADAKRAQAQEAMDKIVKDKEAELERRLTEQRAEAQQRIDALETARAGTKDRIESQKSRVKGFDAELARLEARIKEASAAEKAKLQEQIRVLEKSRDDALALIASNKCLAMAVPPEFVTPFLQTRGSPR